MIAGHASIIFGLNIDKDVVRRILARYYRPAPDPRGGPSWLTFIGHAEDCLWSVGFFQCESILLKSHWVLVVMDQFTRRIIGFNTTDGKRIFASWMLKKSKAFLMCLYLILLSNGLLERFGANILTKHFFGMLATWRESWGIQGLL